MAYSSECALSVNCRFRGTRLQLKWSVEFPKSPSPLSFGAKAMSNRRTRLAIVSRITIRASCLPTQPCVPRWKGIHASRRRMRSCIDVQRSGINSVGRTKHFGARNQSQSNAKQAQGARRKAEDLTPHQRPLWDANSHVFWYISFVNVYSTWRSGPDGSRRHGRVQSEGFVNDSVQVAAMRAYSLCVRVAIFQLYFL